MPIRANDSIHFFGTKILPHQPCRSRIQAGIDHILVLANYCTIGGADANNCRRQQEERAECIHGRFLWGKRIVVNTAWMAAAAQII
jgi:hypothetical protein